MDPEAKDIFEAINRGKNKIAVRVAEKEAARQKQIAEWKQEWLALEADIRAALPELVRPYMRSLLHGVADENIFGFPNRYQFRIYIDIPCLAPIMTNVERERAGNEFQIIHQPAKYQHGYDPLYIIPSFNRFDSTLDWDYRNGTGCADLDEALAIACEQFELYEKAVQERESSQVITESQPQYEPVGDSQPAPGLLVDLRSFVRDVVREVVQEEAA